MSTKKSSLSLILSNNRDAPRKAQSSSCSSSASALSKKLMDRSIKLLTRVKLCEQFQDKSKKESVEWYNKWVTMSMMIIKESMIDTKSTNENLSNEENKDKKINN